MPPSPKSLLPAPTRQAGDGDYAEQNVRLVTVVPHTGEGPWPAWPCPGGRECGIAVGAATTATAANDCVRLQGCCRRAKVDRSNQDARGCCLGALTNNRAGSWELRAGLLHANVSQTGAPEGELPAVGCGVCWVSEARCLLAGVGAH
jgi:hypothetical protein